VPDSEHGSTEHCRSKQITFNYLSSDGRSGSVSIAFWIRDRTKKDLDPEHYQYKYLFLIFYVLKVQRDLIPLLSIRNKMRL
jgi:hypothetical protein